MPAAASATVPAATAMAHAASAMMSEVAEVRGSVVAYVVRVTRSVAAEIPEVKSVARITAWVVA